MSKLLPSNKKSRGAVTMALGIIVLVLQAMSFSSSSIIDYVAVFVSLWIILIGYQVFKDNNSSVNN